MRADAGWRAGSRAQQLPQPPAQAASTAEALQAMAAACFADMANDLRLAQAVNDAVPNLSRPILPYDPHPLNSLQICDSPSIFLALPIFLHIPSHRPSQNRHSTAD